MLLQDLRFAFRMLRKNPGFTLVAVVSLAIGIGANSAMFSLGDAVLLRPLPVERPNEVVTLSGKTPRENFGGISYRDYVDYRDRNRSFAGLAAFTMVPFGLSSTPDKLPQVRYGLLVSGNFLNVMGVNPEIGRNFRPEEDQAPGRDAVVILGHDLWMQEFGGDRSVVGRHVRLNGVDFSVIGVMPERFTGMDQYFHVAMLVPVMMSPRLAASPTENLLESRDTRGLSVKGRLKPGVTIEQAQSEMAGIAKGLEQAYPDTNREQGIGIRTELQKRIERSPPDAALLGMLATLAMLVLLVACANVANLLLSKSRARSREMSVRVAIGAGRTRLVRQLLTESLLVGLAGGVLGMVVAYGGILFFQQIRIPSDLPFVLDVQLDKRALLAGLAASLASVLLFGLAPAWQISRTDLVSGLKAADADTAGRPRIWGRNLLVMGQIALALVLLVVSSMMYRAFSSQFTGGSGFRTDHIMMMSFDPTLVRYTDAQTRQFYRQLKDRARDRDRGSFRGAVVGCADVARPKHADHSSRGISVPQGQRERGGVCGRGERAILRHPKSETGEGARVPDNRHRRIAEGRGGQPGPGGQILARPRSNRQAHQNRQRQCGMAPDCGNCGNRQVFVDRGAAY